MIRSSQHTLKYTNQNKLTEIKELISDYKLMIQKYINIQWNEQDSQTSFFDAKSYNQILTNRNNDSRLRQCASKQACNMVKSVLAKHHKRIYKLKELQKEGKSTKYLKRKIDLFKPNKPNCDNINVELDPRFINIKITNNEFDLFIEIKEIGNKKVIRIPIKHTKTSQKWINEGQLLSSIRLNENKLTLYFEVTERVSNGNKIIGVDQGLTTCLSLSDGQVTTKNNHNYDLTSILKIMERRKKGSKGFRKAQSHRKNYINWSINQLNFTDVKQVKLEKIKNLRSGKRNSRLLSHWTYSLIKDKLILLCEEKGFQFTENENKFMSQRCNQCGWTHKSNRLGKTFKCGNCQHLADSDLNAASNHAVELFELPIVVWNNHLNRKNGFFWFIDRYEERIVPHVNKTYFL